MYLKLETLTLSLHVMGAHGETRGAKREQRILGGGEDAVLRAFYPKFPVFGHLRLCFLTLCCWVGPGS